MRRTEGDASAAYLIEGTVTFRDLEVLRADGTPLRLEEFAADGRRHWQAMYGHDARLSGEAQQAARDGTPFVAAVHPRRGDEQRILARGGTGRRRDQVRDTVRAVPDSGVMRARRLIPLSDGNACEPGERHRVGVLIDTLDLPVGDGEAEHVHVGVGPAAVRLHVVAGHRREH